MVQDKAIFTTGDQ